MEKIKLPVEVKTIIDTFYKNNFEIFIVGGCVRDSLLHKEPKDWDLCTNALVGDIERIANANNWKVIPTGIKHGTVSVILDKTIYEITTYRIDSNYSDNRHPDSVEFTDVLEKDLARRDFTINAIAYNDDVGFVDPFGGIDDIKKGIIRCVRDPNERFNEDALRMLRAVRFALTLKSGKKSFTIEENTRKAIFDNIELVKNLSAERVNNELVKSLSFIGNDRQVRENLNILFDLIKTYFEENINFRWGIGRVSDVKKTENFNLRLMLFLWEPLDNLQLENRLKYLKFDNNTIRNLNQIQTLILRFLLDKIVVPNRTDIKECMRLFNKQNILAMLQFFSAEPNNIEWATEFKNAMSEITENKECIFMSDLAVDGSDIIKEFDVSGEIIGKILNKLLYYVYIDDSRNNYNNLIEYAKRLKEIGERHTGD